MTSLVIVGYNLIFTPLFTEMPFGQVPVLEIEGQEELIAQSYTILRYLGKELGEWKYYVIFNI